MLLGSFPGQARQWLFTDAKEPYRKLCLQEAARFEKHEKIPDYLLQALVYVESGIHFNEDLGYQSWPWAIQAEGKSYFPKNSSDAVEILKKQVEKGNDNFDVGCTQINWKWHQKSFRHLKQAITPRENVRYAVWYLKKLYERHGSWRHAVRHYHSPTKKRQDFYEAKVYQTRDAMMRFDQEKKSSESVKLVSCLTNSGSNMFECMYQQTN